MRHPARLLLVLAAATAGCGREAPPAAAVPAPGAALESALCARTWRSEAAGWSVDVPCGAVPHVEFENEGRGPEVIRQRVVVRGQGGADLVVDVWDNQERLGLDAWLDRHGEFAVYGASRPLGRTRVGPRGFEGVAARSGGERSPLKEFVVFSTGPHVVRLMYVDTDGGGSLAAFRRMVETFDEEVRP